MDRIATPVHRPPLPMKFFLGLAMSLATLFLHAPSYALEEGADYLIAPDPAPVPSKSAEIKVTEFFNISCPACNAWQAPIDKWLVDKPEGVTWTRSPVPFERWGGLYARAYFVLEAFDSADKLSDFFTAFHSRRLLLNSESRIAEWLSEEHNIDEDKAEDAFGSFGVDTKMRRTERIIERFGISSTPTFLVADRYILTPTLSRNPEKLFDTMDGLIAAIRDGTAI